MLLVRAANNTGILNRNYLFPDIPDASTPAGRIRKARILSNHTIRKLAKKAGVSEVSLSNIENGRSPPSIKTLKAISPFLDTSIAELGCFEDLPEDTLGQKILKARMSCGMCRKEIADSIGISERTIFNWEKDYAVSPKEQLSKLYSTLF